MNFLIYKSFFKKKTLFNYVLICFLLLILLFLIFSYEGSIKKGIVLYQNDIELRTIEVNFYDKYSIENLKLEQYVEKIELDQITNNYKIIIKNSKYINKYIISNKKFFSFYSVNNNGQISLLEKLNKLCFVMCLLVIIVSIILMVINVFELLSSEKKNLALYKLLGYKNIYLVLNLLIFLSVLHFFVYIVSMLISQGLVVLINYILNTLDKDFILTFISTKNKILILGGIYTLIIINSIFMFYIIKKVSPINLFKNSN